MSALAANLTNFGRVLRRAGLPLGNGQIVAAGEALRATGIADRQEFKAALRATMVMRASDLELFDHAFDAFWRSQDENTLQMAALLPQTHLPPAPLTPGARRIGDALRMSGKSDDTGELALDASGSASGLETLRSKDFAQMSAAELNAARNALARLDWRLPQRRTRRTDPSAYGRIDARRTLTRMRKTLGEPLTLTRKCTRSTEPPLVALIDISGSMSDYSRVILHFLHAMMRTNRRRMDVFAFGTRLTNISRALRHRDIDSALAGVSALAPDWDGGTRIGAALDKFHRVWARRVLCQGAHVLLITDGLEREDPEGLARAAKRLRLAARGVTWANPLLRYDGFEAKAQGVKALLPHVNRMVPVHNLNSVAALVEALGKA